MLGRAFLLASAAFLGLLAFAFCRDANRDYIPVQQKYLAKYVGTFAIGIQQLFPKVQVNGNFQVERCITCHVPDITKIGPQQAAQRLGGGHPSVIDDAVFAKYGQDTLICRTGVTAAASPAATPSPGPSPTASPRASRSATTATGRRPTRPALTRTWSLTDSRCMTPRPPSSSRTVRCATGRWAKAGRARHSTTRTAWDSSTTTTTSGASSLATRVQSTSARSCRPGV